MTGFDREKAREVLIAHGMWGGEEALDALAGCVTDEPPTIDRDALRQVLLEEHDYVYEPAVDRILALLRPDPRIAKLEALCDVEDQRDAPYPEDWPGTLMIGDVRAILRGDA